MLMSFFASDGPVGRRDAMKNDFPSRETNGQPSRAGPLNEGSDVSDPSTRTACDQAPYAPRPATAADDVTAASATTSTAILVPLIGLLRSDFP
jgi:hypothetical protein